ncbi:zinc finger, CCHC-type containing protein [Tanacetum coccineum]
MDVKTTFLNGDLEEEVYMKQSGGFVMPGNEHKVYKLIKSLYGLKQAPKHWHQKFDEVVFSSGFLPNQSDKCVYSKLDDADKGVIICLYVYDMLIFGTDQNQVDKTKEFLSSKFSMKDMGEKILKKFNREDSSPMSTPIDPVEKLKPNTRKPVDQLKYSRAIGCLMYAITRTRPDIAYAVGTMNHGLSYVGYPSVLEAYSYASWINHVKDSSFTSGWVFLLGGGVVSWASKKQSCITSSTMEFEFVALVAAGKDVEWLRNLIHEIPIWLKPIASISIHCDITATLAKAYSQIYNGKSRHLGVRHSMIRELIMNGVISIEFVWSQHNLADHLMKVLARDLVIKSVIGMRLKSIDDVPSTPARRPPIRAQMGFSPRLCLITFEYKEYDEEREMEPRREQIEKPLHLSTGGLLGPSELRARENGSRGISIPPLLAAYLGRSENGQALQSSFTSIYGGH